MKRKKITMDGNAATAHVAYAFSEMAAIYPITPSSSMGEDMDRWSGEGRLNIFGQPVKIVQMQSEGGAAGAVHGGLISGAYANTFTASQGLLLMIPNMYKIAGEQLPAVFHVAARAVSTHALSIFGDHSDVMATRQTGFVMLASNSVQEAMDLSAVAHLSAISSSMPVLHFFDGFRTSHEEQKIEVWEYDELRGMVDWDAVRKYKDRAMSPLHPHLKGSAEQPETFFQHREAVNTQYSEVRECVSKYMKLVNKKIGSNYDFFNYYGADDATDIIVAMGSVCDCIEEVVDYLLDRGKKVGLIKVHLYRPFCADKLIEAIPDTVKNISVLDRTKEAGALGEPLYMDVAIALKKYELNNFKITHGRYGLGAKDVQPKDILAVYENMWNENNKEEFTISIEDDVTGLSLRPTVDIDTQRENVISCKFWGIGSDGTVGANKNTVKIIGDNTDKMVQGFYQYDSKKSDGLTVSHLRISDEPIKSAYYVKHADFVACHASNYLLQYDMVQEIKPGGTFLLNCPWNDDELEEKIPGNIKRYIADNDIKFYVCNAMKIAEDIGLGSRKTNTVLQAVFFKLTGIIPIKDAIEYMKEAVYQSYATKGEDIVKMNIAAIEAGINGFREIKIPKSWYEAKGEVDLKKLIGKDDFQTDYLNDILIPTNRLKGDLIPVSKFVKSADGSLPAGTAAYEKRSIATQIPHWISSNCIQCNRCANVCPHAVIRPFIIPSNVESHGETIELNGHKDKKFAIRISALDCTGCASCVSVCPAKKKALEMADVGDASKECQKEYDYAFENFTTDDIPFTDDTVKGSQFRQPLLEFSGACPGCGETPYAKLITQLFGDRMYIANATGCSSIWGCSAPSTPYTVKKNGRGPAWANSLFEDNAEFGMGMAIAAKVRRSEMKEVVLRLGKWHESSGVKKAANDWLKYAENTELCESMSDVLKNECKKHTDSDCEYVTKNSDALIKPSIWIFGGDGWAYDIGYGGLDHVLASNENVNVCVFDTEVYSNTGGQASKATPMGAVARFATSGKKTKKKNLAQMAMSYGYVYVAQVAMGADQEQTLKAIKEAESYDGASLIICYSPCINHGIKSGMAHAMDEMKRAVASGYWNLFRYNPALELKGENPLIVDSKMPNLEFEEFLKGEVRFDSLKLKYPEYAEKLLDEAKRNSMVNYDKLLRYQKSLKF